MKNPDNNGTLSMEPKTKPSEKSRRLGAWAGILSLFSRPKLSATKKDIQKQDFPANTQKIGLRFPDSLRDFFRFRWLRGR
jgi:hypothetical protein